MPDEPEDETDEGDLLRHPLDQTKAGAPTPTLVEREECASRQGGECRRRVKMQENQISAQVPLQNTVDWHGVQFALRLQIAQFLSLWVVTFVLHSAICLQTSDFRFHN